MKNVYSVLAVAVLLSSLVILVWLGLGDNVDTDTFLQQHWDYPIAPQGTPPEQYSALEASLDPESCGQCHIEQHRQWSESLHSETMGPGIRWQLQLADAKTAKSCLRCHAPMSEQLALQWQERGWSANKQPPPAHIPKQLHRQGLVCAACHVRGHTRYGPQPRKEVKEPVPHNGFVTHKAFTDSRFCATCHQFKEGGPSLNGKLREDTYNQWRATPYAEDGVECQNCHMPQRKHLWKGIHDVDTTRSAMSTELKVESTEGGGYSVTAKVENSGAGHHFPTYLVPEIVLYLEYVTPAGEAVLLERYVIAWRANLALTEELFDRRLSAGEAIEIEGSVDPDIDPSGEIRLRVSVSPREHYIRTFESYLESNASTLPPKALQLLQQAIEEARNTRYGFIAAQGTLVPVAN